jgi:hypothetical protein
MNVPRKRETITVDVPGLRGRINEASEGRPGPWVRTLIEQALQAPSRPSTRVVARRSRTVGAKTTLFLLPHEHEALVNGALAEGLSQSEYVGRLAAAEETGAAFIGREACRLLGQSNLQLVRIGTNLNQIARSLNAMARQAPGMFTEVDRQRIETAAQTALNHVRLVASFIEQRELTRRKAARRRREDHGNERPER